MRSLNRGHRELQLRFGRMSTVTPTSERASSSRMISGNCGLPKQELTKGLPSRLSKVASGERVQRQRPGEGVRVGGGHRRILRKLGPVKESADQPFRNQIVGPDSVDDDGAAPLEASAPTLICPSRGSCG